MSSITITVPVTPAPDRQIDLRPVQGFQTYGSNYIITEPLISQFNFQISQRKPCTVIDDLHKSGIRAIKYCGYYCLRDEIIIDNNYWKKILLDRLLKKFLITRYCTH